MSQAIPVPRKIKANLSAIQELWKSGERCGKTPSFTPFCMTSFPFLLLISEENGPKCLPGKRLYKHENGKERRGHTKAQLHVTSLWDLAPLDQCSQRTLCADGNVLYLHCPIQQLLATHVAIKQLKCI